jgi:hypothetical protein
MYVCLLLWNSHGKGSVQKGRRRGEGVWRREGRFQTLNARSFFCFLAFVGSSASPFRFLGVLSAATFDEEVEDEEEDEEGGAEEGGAETPAFTSSTYDKLMRRIRVFIAYTNVIKHQFHYHHTTDHQINRIVGM